MRLVLLPVLAAVALTGCGKFIGYGESDSDRFDVTGPRPEATSGTHVAAAGPAWRPAWLESQSASPASTPTPWFVPPDCRDAAPGYVPELARRIDGPGSFSEKVLRVCAEAGAPAARLDQTLVTVSISGGGNKSAVFAAEVLFELRRYGLDKHIDMVSAVSGGSVAAALYGLSVERPDDPFLDLGPEIDARRPVWDHGPISEQLDRNLLYRFILQRFSPSYLYKRIFTEYDTGNVLAQVFTESIFEDQETGEPYTLAHFNPRRPSIILNTNNVTKNRDGFLCRLIPDGFAVSGCDRLGGSGAGATGRVAPLEGSAAGVDIEDLKQHLPFTTEFFTALGLRTGPHDVGRAVAASAAFPLIIRPLTLFDYFCEDRAQLLAGTALKADGCTDGTRQYAHVLDGGIHDNIGLVDVGLNLAFLIDCMDGRCPSRFADYYGQMRSTLSIIVDSSLAGVAGRDPEERDPHSFDTAVLPVYFSQISESIDNIQHASKRQRKAAIQAALDEAPALRSEIMDISLEELAFEGSNGTANGFKPGDYHVATDRETLWKALETVQTSFKLEEYEAICLRHAARYLVARKLDPYCREGGRGLPGGMALRCPQAATPERRLTEPAGLTACVPPSD